MARHDIRAIIHLAALQVPFCKADPAAGARVNVVGTVNVLEAARRHGLKRVAYASSIAAYSFLPGAPWLATLYGAYKLCDEMIARTYAEDWAVPSVGIRPGVVYGVGRDQGMTSKTTVAILAAAAGRPYTVPYSGEVSALHAGEIASAFIKAVSKERDGAPVFDLNGRATSVAEWLDHRPRGGARRAARDRRRSPALPGGSVGRAGAQVPRRLRAGAAQGRNRGDLRRVQAAARERRAVGRSRRLSRTATSRGAGSNYAAGQRLGTRPPWNQVTKLTMSNTGRPRRSRSAPA